MTTSPEIDPKTPELMQRLVGDIAAVGGLRLCAIGDELGLFTDLAKNGPATSEELAARTGLNERYLREWIYGTSIAGYLEFDKASRKVSIPAAHIPVLADECGPMFLGGTLNMVNDMLKPYNRVIESFRRGGGVNYDEYDDSMWQNLQRHSCVRYKNLLIQQWMPEMPDIAARLSAGGTLADFGCGAGGSTVEMAKAFPQARLYGFDLVPDNIEIARKKAEDAGVADRVDFQLYDLSAQGAPDQFDVIATFDLIHDMADPQGGLNALRKAVKDDGFYILMDVTCEDDPADNDGPMAVFKFCASLHYCMTTSLANDGVGLGTCGLPESRVNEYCKKAGFSSVRRLPVEHPMNVLYEVRP